MMATFSLSGQSLTRAYGQGAAKTTALQHASLDLIPGQMVLLMGPSGSGKSTLLAILSGLLRPDSGRVIALNQDLWSFTDRQREQFRRLHCGFVFQGFNLFPALTARQQMEIVLRWGGGVPFRQARHRVDEMLDFLGLSRKANQRPDQLSGGEKQRVAIGRALIKEPALCFADEPTSALDWSHGEQVVRLLRSAADDRGATVLVVSHDPRLVAHADQVFHLEDGGLTDDAMASEPLARSHS